MPAPRAVLRDLHDQGMDPRHPHTHIGPDGRLTKFDPIAVPPPPAPKAGLVKIPSVKVVAPPPLPPVVEEEVHAVEVVAEEPVAVEAEVKAPVEEAKEPEASGEVEVVASSKKSKAKKADKPAA